MSQPKSKYYYAALWLVTTIDYNSEDSRSLEYDLVDTFGSFQKSDVDSEVQTWKDSARLMRHSIRVMSKTFDEIPKQSVITDWLIEAESNLE